MKDKINIAELLKDCPKDMEFDCTICNNRVTLEGVAGNGSTYPIRVISKDGFHHILTCSGGVYDNEDAKCVIFPKGKTTWEGFQRPFKDGDIIFTHANCLKVGLGNTWISIFQEKRNGGVATYVDYAKNGGDFYSYNEDKGLLCMDEDIMRQRFATEEEKQKLFDAIKANGYKWNEETKILEKLTPNKFDITTLVPFESRVLVRGDKNSYWKPAVFGCYIKTMTVPYYALGGTCWEYCIPYEGNEHLLGTTDDCDEYFKTWK